MQGHMCRFGMSTHIEDKNGERGFVKTPTGLLPSSKCVREQLGLRCDGGHAHIPLVGGRASGAQVYPQALCEAICKGVAMQKEADALMKVSTGRMTEGELKSFSGLISSVHPWGSNDIRRVMSIKEAAGKTHPIGDYPGHCVDEWRELEGCDDEFGVSPQRGVSCHRPRLMDYKIGISYGMGTGTWFLSLCT